MKSFSQAGGLLRKSFELCTPEVQGKLEVIQNVCVLKTNPRNCIAGFVNKLVLFGCQIHKFSNLLRHSSTFSL